MKINIKHKNLFLIGSAAILFGIAGVLVFASNLGGLLKNGEPAGIILFYGNGCPHCENVEKFIKDKNITSKIQFSELEVFNNDKNAKILREKARICRIDSTQIGVPFLWDGQKCFLGEDDVISFLKSKAGIK